MTIVRRITSLVTWEISRRVEPLEEHGEHVAKRGRWGLTFIGVRFWCTQANLEAKI